MDDHRFDQLSRRIGVVVSRRTGLGALLAGVVALLGPAAADEALANKDNGGRDGGREHGRNRPHRPGKHKDNRKGKRQRKRPGNSGGKGSTPCIAVGQAGCYDASSCCAGAKCYGDAVCRTGACAAPGAACPNGIQDCCIGAVCASGTCCGESGGSCNSATDCCGELVCSAAGICTATCAGNNGYCLEDDDCCFGSSCIGNPGEANCCVLEGGQCEGGGDGFCCGTNSCRYDGTCGPCQGAQLECENDNDCCQGLLCVENQCFSG